eukprot:scaffold99443_cov31-Tisochrysis_lutea.AAC.1
MEARRRGRVAQARKTVGMTMTMMMMRRKRRRRGKRRVTRAWIGVNERMNVKDLIECRALILR